MKLILKITTITLAISCISCSDKFTKLKDYGLTHNEVRKSIGLPVLQNNWISKVKFTENKIIWLSPIDLKKEVAHYFNKTIIFDKSGAISEDDSYISGRWVSLKAVDPDSGDGWEEITIRYHYRSKTWECYWTSEKGLKTITKSEADKLLKSWGL